MSVGKSATPLGKVRGLGSAQHGGGHWIEERFYSVVLVLLSLWLLFSLMMLPALDRATGSALTVAGLALLTWWLLAIANGAEAYDQFVAAADHPLGVIVLVGLTWAFWQHFFSGLRHLFMDMGAGLELKINRFWSVMTIVAAVAATVLTFAILSGFLPAILSGEIR